MVAEMSSRDETVDLYDTVFHYNAPTDVVADAFLSLAERDAITDVTQMKLNKLMYLAQAQYLAATNHRLFRERLEAYRHGPIVPSLRYRFSACKDRSLTEAPFDEHALDQVPQDMRSFIEQVWDKYKGYTASQLRDMSHKDPAWKSVYRPNAQHLVMDDKQIAQTVINAPWQERISNPNVVLVNNDMMNSINWDKRVADAVARTKAKLSV